MSSELINNKLDKKVLTTITPYDSLFDQNDIAVLLYAFDDPDPNSNDILKNEKINNQLSLTTSFPTTRSLNDSLEVLINEFKTQGTKYPETKSFTNQLRNLARSLDSPSAFEDPFIKNEILSKQPNLQKFMNKDITVETTAVPTNDKSANNKSANNKSANNKSANNKSANNKSANNKSANKKSANNKSTNKRNLNNRHCR
jgi:hypothetical protein